ncbi:MAG: DUF971 domain-containing protein [Acidobacteria bacterium]|nr:DUF971 domain-containing protein [Acidobacteriota bacterium]
MAPRNTDPRHVDISLSQGIKIVWGDGHESQYPLDHLRRNCPCAACHSTAQSSADTPAAASPFPMFKPAPRLTDAESVGRYAVRLLWADGHSSGIYSFDHLRDICPCAECRKNKP